MTVKLTSSQVSIPSGGTIDFDAAAAAYAALLRDVNDNELLDTQAIAEAVNQVGISNATTGNAPAVVARGGDTNINLELTPKGSGIVTVNSKGLSLILQAHKTTVGANQTAAEIFEFTTPFALTLVNVQVYCTATAATASVDVREAGVSVLSAAATPSAGAVVTPTISDSAIASGAALTVNVTTDGTGSITDLTVTMRFTY
jgi:hypothetical protein